MKKQLPPNLEKFRITDDPRINAIFEKQTAGSIEGFFKTPYDNCYLAVMCGCGEGWDHVSVSLPNRCPTWDEMSWIKSLFFEPEETVIQYHPAQSAYINCATFALHLWRPWDYDIKLPPAWMLV